MKEKNMMNTMTTSGILTALLRKAVDGDANAAYHAALLMQDMNHDEVVIQNQLRRSANGGCIEAIRWLAMLGLSKHLVTPNSICGHITYYSDYDMAMSWITKGVEMDDALCGMLLAKCYQNGIGISKDTYMAETLMEQVIERLNFEQVYTLSQFFAAIIPKNTAANSASVFKRLLAS